MRRKLTLLTFLIFAMATTLAQTSIGVKAGRTFSSLILENVRIDLGDPDIPQENEQGLVGGFIFRHFIQEHVGLQVELNVNQRGWRELNDTIPRFRMPIQSTTLTYLEIPFMTNIYLGKRKTRYFVNLGVNPGYLLSTSEEFRASREDEITYRINDENEETAFVGILGGLGVNRKTPVGHFQVELRYNLGVTNIFDKDFSPDLPDRSQVQTIEIYLAYLFELKPLNPK